ncbi:MAG: molybdopterin cofactor-binding domain-containing protein [Myxococcota bacterium]
MSQPFSRRHFLKSLGAASTGLLVSFFLPLPGCAAPPLLSTETEPLTGGASSGDPSRAWINAWIRIGEDNIATLRLAASEMGQGVMTALPMILAEELEIPWAQVHVEMAPAHEAYYREAYGEKTMLTADSQSIRGYYLLLRQAGAAARHMLTAAAAQTWGVPEASCEARDGEVRHPESNRSLTYGALAVKAAQLTPPKEPVLKDPSTFRVIGSSPERLDVRDKVTGKATFGIDIKRPGMLYAVVKASPTFGGTLQSVDDSALKGMPGNPQRVELPNGVAVVADSTWRAKKGLEALKLKFEPGPNANMSTSSISAQLRAGLDEEGRVAEKEGDVDAALAQAPKVLEAIYEVPYLYHSTLEPMNCTVELQADRCDVWVPTQAQKAAQDLVAKQTGLKLEQVFIHTTYLGGGFGRRGEVDFIAQALTVAQAVKKPVKLVWTREEDMTHDFYRPAFVVKFKGAVGADGLPSAWFSRSCGQNILERVLPSALFKGAEAAQFLSGTTVDVLAVQGLFQMPYALPARRMEYVKKTLPVPVGFWRSVGHSHNAFFFESFLDELAHEGKQDPYQLRRTLLKDNPRALRVLDTAAKLSGWGQAPTGRAQGIALHESFGSLVAQVAEVSVSAEGALTVHKVSCAVDPGIIIHPDIVRAQMEGCIGFGLSSMLGERIELEGGAVVQQNFHQYPLLRLGQMPEVLVELVPTLDAPVGGIGEPGLPPLIPAVTNAIFALTGVRIRSLPLAGQKLT